MDDGIVLEHGILDHYAGSDTRFTSRETMDIGASYSVLQHCLEIVALSWVAGIEHPTLIVCAAWCIIV
jgi:hypothetical protein